MKKQMICMIALILGVFYETTGQNLVPNPSFEEMRGLPVKKLPVNNFRYERKSSYKAFKNHLNYWFSGNKATPDLRILNSNYYNNCVDKQSYCDRAKTGKNVIGLLTYMRSLESNTYREYLEVKLKEPLKPGIKTYVELWVKNDPKSKLVSNNLGWYFSRRKVYANILEPIAVTPQVNHDELILRADDDWIKMEGSFIPEHAYAFLTIGNFFHNEETKIETKQVLSPDAYRVSSAYYLIDDVRVWQEGSPVPVIKKEEISVGKTFTLNDIEFDSNSADLKSSSFPELNKLIDLLKEEKKLTIGIYGHTDDVGSDAANVKLSTARAKTIKQYIVSKGISEKRMTYKGFGESKPIAENTTETGRKKNRRVEIEILETE